MSRDALTIRIVHDIVCPWCFIGEVQLDRVLNERPELAVQREYVPFQLHPHLPMEGADRRELYAQKFGTQRALEHVTRRLLDAGERVGIGFRFEARQRVPNTLRAHALIRRAAAAGKAHEVVNALYCAYFLDGRDVGSPRELARIAGERGLDEDTEREALELGADTDEVRDAAEDIRDHGITGVPCFIIGGFPVPGAQDGRVLASVIDRALAKRASRA